MTRVRGSKSRTERKTVIGDKEFHQLLNQAAQIKDKFFRLRASALLCVLRLTGKRRSEISMLEVDSIKIEEEFLNITFTLLKKRKGTVLTKQAVKQILLTDCLTEPILEYLEYLQNLKLKPRYFFPSGKSIFGQAYVIQTDRHLSGRQLFNILRNLTNEAWCHLFRETVGSDVIKSDPTIIGVFKVMRRLDLEDYRTGFNYLRRYAGDVIRREEEKQKQ